MDILFKEPGKGKSYHRGMLTPASSVRVQLAVAMLMASAPLYACAVPAAIDGYAANKYGDKARERDKEIRKLEKERDDLAFEGVKTQAQVMRKALIEKRLYDLYNRKLGRKR